MTEHTQEPWCINCDDGESIGILGNAGNNAKGQKYVAAVQYDENRQKEYLPTIPSHNEAKANAALIAAAPELLAALAELLGDTPAIQGGVCQHCGRDYISEKIISEMECPSDDCPHTKARAAIAKAKPC